MDPEHASNFNAFMLSGLNSHPVTTNFESPYRDVLSVNDSDFDGRNGDRGGSRVSVL
jgi:hypothetical protein